jgi:hypothetical protein
MHFRKGEFIAKGMNLFVLCDDGAIPTPKNDGNFASCDIHH